MDCIITPLSYPERREGGGAHLGAGRGGECGDAGTQGTEGSLWGGGWLTRSWEETVGWRKPASPRSGWLCVEEINR